MDRLGGATHKPGTAGWFEVPLFALQFLCFLQLLTDFVANVYAVGLLQRSLPPEIACMFLLFTPPLLLLFRRISARFVVLTGELMLLSRLASLALDTRGKMLAAGIGSGAFFLFFPATLWRLRNERDHAGGRRLSVALALATLLYVFLQALNSGNDITGFGAWRYLGGSLTVVAGVLLWVWGRHATRGTTDEPTAPENRGKWRMAGLCLGLTGVLAMLCFGLAFPAVLARWTDSNYLWVTALTTGPTGLWLALRRRIPGLRLVLSSGVLLGWNLLFLAALALTVWSSRVPLPADARAYPFLEPPVGWPGQVGLPLMLILSPVLYVNFARFAGAVAEGAPSVRTLAWSFTLAALVLLLLVLAQVFTTAYDYIPVVGPWFRDRFWLVCLAAGSVASVPVLLVRSDASGPAGEGEGFGSPTVMAVSAALAVAAIGAAAMTRAHPGKAAVAAPLRVMTFNLQQGYSAKGTRNFAGQLELIRRVDPDLVGLQETDTARLAGGNSDLVRFLANRLNYHACAGPRTGAGTFGIALLSRLPIEAARTFYLYSTGEQTAVLAAEIRVRGTSHSVFVTHLGNGGPLIQQREILDLVAGKTNVILMGDFNFRPGREQYQLTLGRLEDAWLMAAEKRIDPPGLDLNRRIDHVFLSRGTPVRRAAYLDPGASDHPTMVVEVGDAR